MERGHKIHESVPPPINPGVYPSLQRGGGRRVILIYSGGYQVAQNYLMDHTAYVMIEKEKRKINNNNNKTAQQY